MKCMRCKKGRPPMWNDQFCKKCINNMIETSSWVKRFMKKRRMLNTRAKNKALKEAKND